MAAERPIAGAAFAALDFAKQTHRSAEASTFAESGDAAICQAAACAATAINVEAQLVDEPERPDEYFEPQAEAYRQTVVAKALALKNAGSGSAVESAIARLSTYARVCLESDLGSP